MLRLSKLARQPNTDGMIAPIPGFRLMHGGGNGVYACLRVDGADGLEHGWLNAFIASDSRNRFVHQSHLGRGSP